MPATDHFVGGGVTESFISPVVLVMMIISMILVMTLPKRHLIGPVLLSAFLIPIGNSLYLVGAHWFVFRLVILVGLLRVMIMKSSSRQGLLCGGFNGVDKAFYKSMICQAVGFSLQYMSSSAVVNQAGALIDFIGGYFLLRVLIYDEADVYRTLKWIAFLSVLLACTMVWEQLTTENIFGFIGNPMVPAIREGKIRSQGVFQHALTAGAFGSTLPPLFLLLWSNGKAKFAAALGLLGCTVMTICSNSSTPLLSYVAGLGALTLWPFRKDMRTLRRGFAAVLVVLHLVMKAPVWFLIARVDLTGGSSGYHRAELIDAFITHFWEWWLIGTNNFMNWGYDLWDAQNQFVNVGETGGLAALVLYIAMISRSYAALGNARKRAETKREQWALWFLGSAMFSNIVSFFGTNYFDQVKLLWFMVMAMITAVTAPILSGVPKASQQQPPSQPSPWLYYSPVGEWSPACPVSNCPAE